MLLFTYLVVTGYTDIFALAASAGPSKEPSSIEETFVTGRVNAMGPAVLNNDLLAGSGIASRTQKVQIEILEGKKRGTTVEVTNEIGDNPAFNILLQPGREVVLSVVDDKTAGGASEVNIADYHRAPVLVALALAFIAVYLYFGGSKGLKSLAGLLLGFALIAWVLLPLAAQGVNALAVAAVLCVVITLATTTLVAGFSRKALAAVAGTTGGVLVAGIAAQLVITSAPLTGLSSEEAQILRASVLNQPPEFFSGLLAAGMLIGALGVIMDVAVSIASAAYEVHQTDPELSVGQLYARGMNVGKDIMGTMTNTLILAYTGSALPLLLLMAQIPSPKLINLDLVATEITAALSGSLGLVCTIPLTALSSAWLFAQDDPFNKLSNSQAQDGSNSGEVS